MCRAAARGQEAAVRIGPQDALPIGQSGVDVQGEGGDAGIGEQAVDETEPLQGCAHRLFDVGFHGDITHHRPRFDALGA
jgi:hypothetical protein